MFFVLGIGISFDLETGKSAMGKTPVEEYSKNQAWNTLKFTGGGGPVAWLSYGINALRRWLTSYLQC
jgi:hypothetical protein